MMPSAIHSMGAAQLRDSFTPAALAARPSIMPLTLKANQNTAAMYTAITMFCPSTPRVTLADKKATSAPISTDSAVSSRGRVNTVTASRTQNRTLCPTPLWVMKVHTAPAGASTNRANSRFSR